MRIRSRRGVAPNAKAGHRLVPSDGALAGSPSSLGYQPQLDGLRAVAVLAVVASHAGGSVLEGGSVGVDVFFVLSGFLITTLLVDEYDSRHTISLRRFYRRRSLRLLPALAAVLIFVAITFPVLRPIQTGDTLIGIPASMFYVSSWIRAFDISQLGWLGHTWSLSVEEHFYVVWPLLVILICRYARRRIVVLTFLLFAASGAYRALWQIAGASAFRLYNSPDMRAEQILGGCLLAVLVPRMRSREIGPAARHLGLALFAASVVVLAARLAIPSVFVVDKYLNGVSSSYYYNGASTVIAVAAGIVIAHLVIWRRGLAAKLLSSDLLVWLGRRSYGIYLWHVPLLGLVFVPDEPALLRFPLRIGAIFLSLVVAELSYRFVETPFLRRRPNTSLDVMAARPPPP